MSITLIIGFKAKRDRLEDFSRLLDTVKSELPGTEGCQDIRVFRNVDDATSISLVETWTSKADHQAHFEAIVASGAWEHVKSHLAAEPVSAYYQDVHAGA